MGTASSREPAVLVIPAPAIGPTQSGGIRLETFAEPLRIGTHMSGFGRPWFIAGGWAIDLFLGRLTRKHEDIDIAILRRDQYHLMRHLSGWEFMKVVPHNGHTLEPWRPNEWLDLPIHEVHARRRGTPSDRLEILLDEADDETWSFRRNSAVRRSLSRIGMTTQAGIPILSPEIVLLYKAAEPHDKNQADFENVWGSLEPERRAWLAQALVTCYPSGHPWLEAKMTTA